MTREEAVYRVKGYLTDIIPAEDYSEVEEIIGALEQEPCEDAISRVSAINAVSKALKRTFVEYEKVAKGIINKLSSVNPQPETGHWIAVYQGDEIINYRCSECEFGNTFGKNTDGMYYCPNCGAKMAESEDKE